MEAWDDGFLRREFSFSRQDFAFLAALAERRLGLMLSLSKAEMVYSRLARRLRQRRLPDFAAYCRLLQDEGGDEMPHFIHAITTHLTAFFREEHHFTALQAQIFPALEERQGSRRRLRLWCAACSSGEEAYSLAMAVQEYGRFADWDVQILATDVDVEVLAQACAGVYAPERVIGLHPERQRRFFSRRHDGLYQVHRDLASMISFRPGNLLEPGGAGETWDVIFCRNVMIYFSPAQRQRLISQFARVQLPQSYLALGHAETIGTELAQLYGEYGQTLYRRCG